MFHCKIRATAVAKLLCLAGKLLCLVGMLLCLAGGCAGGSWRGQVVSVADGARLYIRRGEETFPVRLHGVSVPRPGRPGGLHARRYMVLVAMGKEVRVQEVDLDRQHRLIGEVKLGTRSLAEGLIRTGLGWHSPRMGPGPRLALAELEAVRQGRGLWRREADGTVSDAPRVHDPPGKRSNGPRGGGMGRPESRSARQRFR